MLKYFAWLFGHGQRRTTADDLLIYHVDKHARFLQAAETALHFAKRYQHNHILAWRWCKYTKPALARCGDQWRLMIDFYKVAGLSLTLSAEQTNLLIAQARPLAAKPQPARTAGLPSIGGETRHP